MAMAGNCELQEPTKTGRSRRLEDKVACITVYALLGLSWESALVQIAVAGKSSRYLHAHF